MDEDLLLSLASDVFGQLTASAAETAEVGLSASIDEIQRPPKVTLDLKRCPAQLPEFGRGKCR